MHLKLIGSSLLVAGLLAGCSTSPESNTQTSREAPFKRTVAPLTLDEARNLDPNAAKAILVARAALEEAAAKRREEMWEVMKIIVTPAESGWWIHIQYVGGWYQGDPIGVAGGFTDVLVNTKWEVVQISPGA